MKLLLDTHAFLWLDHCPAKLSARAQHLCQDPENGLVLSVVSVWEIQIKMQAGKLRLQFPLGEIIAGQVQRNDIEMLPLLVKHVIELDALPLHHKDPFDRTLIAQARIEGAVLLSADPVMARYPVHVVW